MSVAWILVFDQRSQYRASKSRADSSTDKNYDFLITANASL